MVQKYVHKKQVQMPKSSWTHEGNSRYLCLGWTDVGNSSYWWWGQGGFSSEHESLQLVCEAHVTSIIFCFRFCLLAVHCESQSLCGSEDDKDWGKHTILIVDSLACILPPKQRNVVRPQASHLQSRFPIMLTWARDIVNYKLRQLINWVAPKVRISCSLVIPQSKSISGCPQYVRLQKYFSNPSVVNYFFPTQSIIDLGLQIGGRLLKTIHLGQSTYLADHQQILGFAMPLTSFAMPLTSLCKTARPKPIFWAKPACFDFSSSNFLLQSHILSTGGAALEHLHPQL